MCILMRRRIEHVAHAGRHNANVLLFNAMFVMVQFAIHVYNKSYIVYKVRKICLYLKFQVIVQTPRPVCINSFFAPLLGTIYDVFLHLKLRTCGHN